MLEVYGRTVSLSHPHVDPGEVTKEFGLSPFSIPLQKGVTIRPGSTFGQVTTFSDDRTKEEKVFFNAAGGELEFEPANLKGVKIKGELAFVSFIADGATVADRDDSHGDSGAVPDVGAPDLLYQPEPMGQKDSEGIPTAAAGGQAVKQSTPPPDKTDITAKLADTLVIEPLDGFRMELEDGYYVKERGNVNPKLRFARTRLTYGKKPVAENFEIESDDAGLHFGDSREAIALDARLLGEEILGGADPGNTDVGLALDRKGARLDVTTKKSPEVKAEPAEEKKEASKEEKKAPEEKKEVPKEQKAEKMMVKEITMTIGSVEFMLQQAEKKNERIVAAETAIFPTSSYDLVVEDVQINEQQDKLTGRVKSLSPQTRPDIKITDCDELICDAAGIHTKTATLNQNEKEYELEEVFFEASEVVFAQTVRCSVGEYESVLHNARIRGSGAISFESAEVQTVVHYGMNLKDKKAKYNENAQAFFTFQLGEGRIMSDQFVGGTRALFLASHRKDTVTELVKKEEPKEKSQEEKAKEEAKEKARSKRKKRKKDPAKAPEAAKPKKWGKKKKETRRQAMNWDTRTSKKVDGDIFTDDGFVKLEDAQFDFEREGEEGAGIVGTGSFKFLSIPFDITVPKGKKGEERHFKGKTKAKDDPEDAVDFTIGPDGRINAELDDAVQLSTLRGNDSESLISNITLSGVAIKDSVLTAENIRTDKGVDLEQDVSDETESETAQTLFGMGLHATIARTGGVTELSRDKGIHGTVGKKTLGEFGVSDFLGFMDASGDYAGGKLHAGLKMGAEKEKKYDKIFGDSKHVKDGGLYIPIAGPLTFVTEISPSLSIGAELSADLERESGKSFGEEMEPGEPLNLGGALNVEGSAALGVSTGLALGASFVVNIVSVDLKLTAELGATITASLEAGTALEKKDGKLQQADDLEVEGSIESDVSGSLSLNSDLKVLIWKKRIFSIDLGYKAIDLKPVAVSFKRDKGPDGKWHFEQVGFSAEAFGKKAMKEFKQSQEEQKPTPLAVAEEEARDFGADAEAAWVILEDMKKKQESGKERLYMMTTGEQEALKKRIQTMTKTVQEKLEHYQIALKTYRDAWVRAEVDAAKAVKDARAERHAYQEKDEVRAQTLKNTQVGGFDLENYKMEEMEDLGGKTGKEASAIEKRNKKREEDNTRKRKMASIDFAVARVLGIYDNAVNRIRDDYDTYAQVQNKKMLAKNRETPDEDLYKRVNEMDGDRFLSSKLGSYGYASDQLRADTRFGSSPNQNYFNTLYGYATNFKDLKGFGVYAKAFWKCAAGSNQVFRASLKGYDLLKIILTDKYPEGTCEERKKGKDGKPVDLSGKPINAKPEEKLKALEHLFYDSRDKEKSGDALVRIMMGEKKQATKQDAMLNDTNKVYQALFDSTVQKMTHKGNVDIGKKLKELDEKLAESKEKYLKTVEEHINAQTALENVKAEQAECERKLASLNKDVDTAVKLKSGAVAGATAAVDFVAVEYKEIASGQTMVDAIAGEKKAQEYLKQQQKTM